ncbi:unnamed protein product [Diabrotica balteata]|uniref:Uncharacterized protein n=1 Tax=Diabrotica balteata TaxID=107213 RepID=A0A9N9T6U2_DIABA|nr:unnamed protein product [Diabrotica balteata]
MSKIENIRKHAFSVAVLNGDFKKTEWYVDSAASVHLTLNEDWTNNKRVSNTCDIIVANKNIAKVKCSDDLD